MQIIHFMAFDELLFWMEWNYNWNFVDGRVIYVMDVMNRVDNDAFSGNY